MKDQIERITQMEGRLDRASEALKHLEAALDEYIEAQADLRELAAYLGSDDWCRDFDDDERGLLPQQLKRGVLAEDGIWNVLADARELNVRMLQTVADIMRQR